LIKNALKRKEELHNKWERSILVDEIDGKPVSLHISDSEIIFGWFGDGVISLSYTDEKMSIDNKTTLRSAWSYYKHQSWADASLFYGEKWSAIDDGSPKFVQTYPAQHGEQILDMLVSASLLLDTQE
jgi:hypothetical protein